VLGGSSTSFVSGPLARQTDATSSLLFPLGKGTSYRPLTLIIAAQAAGTVTYTAEQKEGANAQVFDNAASPLDPLTRVSNIRRYTVTASDNTGFSGSIKLSYGPNDDVNNPASPSLAIGKNNGGGWYNIGRTAADASTVTSSSFTSFSDFALASTDADITNNPLPVELLSFQSERQQETVRVTWATASERNNARFEVQRSATSREFHTIASVPGQGTTIRRHDYTVLDQQPLPGLAYYRLRQLDIDGKESFSPAVAVATSREIALYPNPVRTELHLTAPAATYRVLSMVGSMVLAGTATNGTAILDVTKLPAGMYHLEVTTASGRVVRKFIKE
jgi:trimeric autotransporter adhesin